MGYKAKGYGYIVLANWFTDEWTPIKECDVTREMKWLFFTKYFKLYNAAVKLSNPLLEQWNEAYKGEYGLEYAKYLARQKNALYSKVDRLNGKMKIRALVIPGDDTELICGITIIDGKRCICAASLKSLWD